MAHRDPRCPLCPLRDRLKALQAAWLTLPAEARPRVGATKSDPLYVLLTSAPALQKAKAPLETLAVTLDRAGCRPTLADSYAEHLDRGMQGETVHKKSAIDALSECMNTAELGWRLLVGGDAAAMSRTWTGLPVDPRSLAPQNKLDASSLFPFLNRMKTKTSWAVQVGVAAPGSDYVDDHTFFFAKFEGHYLMLQSWVGRFLVLTPPTTVGESWVPDVWDMEAMHFGYMLDSLVNDTDQSYPRTLFMAREQEKFYPTYRILERDFDRVAALGNVTRALPK